ncbi:multidrug MFS transporter [Candidatus Shapirobacteria bacterium CG_4_9_14_0_2_um_filter_39_11]|uniref:Multidrug MFS transporter n=1 Tax=Candidatus Shapirobacteria bacterium CG_4_9_14_0_2_um_filter_39_11 TaxID=1974478 RepID=A0A2M8ES53_9BACT|nr:MAG: multidrug MFS transporter [Candidatus Shapirobacteria bacterium CG_4_9_14_0_2_um_filter_39_11]
MLYDIAKRFIDIVGAVVLIIVFSPVLIIFPILIKLDSPGPVFADIPHRVGRYKKLFRMYKFRSMIANAHDLLKTDPKFRRVYEQYKKNSYKLREDPRITKVGMLLRRFSLDELPQVFNILKGEMSLVGPRAYYPDELKNQQLIYPQSRKYVEELLKAKPGITGYWQVMGRSEINFDKRVRMDAEYARKKSIIQDIIIILKTPWAMISGKGAL